MSGNRRMLFVAPNTYVLRNWIASGLADLVADELNLEPVFASHFEDASFTGPAGRSFENVHVPLDSVQGKELPAGYPRALYALYHLRLRAAAQEVPRGGGQLLRFSRQRDALHYGLRAARVVAPRGGLLRRAARRAVQRARFALPFYDRMLRDLDPACVLVGTPGMFFLDQLVMIAADRLDVDVHCVVNSWDNLVSRGPMMRMPETLMVWNGHMRRHAIELHGCDPERVHIVGALQFSRYADPVTPAERRYVRERVGLADAEPYFLYLGSAEVPRYELEDVRRLLSIIADSEFAGTTPLVVRLHPQVDPAAYEALSHRRLRLDRAPSFQARGGNGLSFGEREMRAMGALLSGTRLVFASAGTTALLEAAIFDRPIIQLRWLDALPRSAPDELARVRDYQSYVHIQDLDATGCRIFSDYPDTLLNDMRVLLADPQLHAAGRRRAVERLVTTPIGAAPQRVVERLADALGYQAGSGRPTGRDLRRGGVA